MRKLKIQEMENVKIITGLFSHQRTIVVHNAQAKAKRLPISAASRNGNAIYGDFIICGYKTAGIDLFDLCGISDDRLYYAIDELKLTANVKPIQE